MYPDVLRRLPVEKSCIHNDHRQISVAQEAGTFPKRAILGKNNFDFLKIRHIDF